MALGRGRELAWAVVAAVRVGGAKPCFALVVAFRWVIAVGSSRGVVAGVEREVIELGVAGVAVENWLFGHCCLDSTVVPVVELEHFLVAGIAVVVVVVAEGCPGQAVGLVLAVQVPSLGLIGEEL